MSKCFPAEMEGLGSPLSSGYLRFFTYNVMPRVVKQLNTYSFTLGISTKHVTEDATAAYHKSFLQQQKIPPFVKNLFLGEFNKSLLSYAEILNDESYLELEVKIKQGTWRWQITVFEYYLSTPIFSSRVSWQEHGIGQTNWQNKQNPPRLTAGV